MFIFYDTIVKEELEERREKAGSGWKVTWCQEEECYEYKLMVTCLDFGRKLHYKIDDPLPTDRELDHKLRSTTGGGGRRGGNPGPRESEEQISPLQVVYAEPVNAGSESEASAPTINILYS